MRYKAVRSVFSLDLFVHHFILLFKQTVTSLKFDRNHIDNEEAKHLAEAIRNNTVIKIRSPHFFLYISSFFQILLTIDLSYNQIDDEGIEYIANVLQNNKVNNIISFVSILLLL